MHAPSLTAVALTIIAVTCTALVLRPIRRRRGHAVFNGGILLAVSLAIAAALPLLSQLPWAELADEATEQAVAALHLLEVAYVILTL
jgi:hypothetical protein